PRTTASADSETSSRSPTLIHISPTPIHTQPLSTLIPYTTLFRSSAGRRTSSNSAKGSNERPSNIGACSTASSPLNINPKTRPALRESKPRSEPNVLTTDKQNSQSPMSPMLAGHAPPRLGYHTPP